MQRINFTESTLNTLKKTANCSFANAVYKLTMKAQQGLKCDDLYKKSVLMNDVNKILCNYKLDECIIFQPELSAYGPSINFPSGGDDTTEYSFYQNDLLISDSYTNEDIVNYFLNLGFGSIGQVPLINPNFIQNPSGWEANNYNSSTQNLYTTNINLYYTLFNTISSPISSEFFNPAYSEEVADAYAISGNIETVYSLVQNSNGNEGNIVWVKIIVRPETCVDYTEEQLNCITPQDLQVLYEFTHKYKETLAKSTKKISNPSSNTNTSNSTDCCTWGSIGGNIGNQSDLVTYLANIEKNYISVEDEGTEITNDVKSINFTGDNVTATDDGNGNVTVNVTGGGGGATNLSYTASPTNGVVNSDTGTDATIPLASGTNAGLMAPTQFTKLSNITVTQVVDLDTIESDTVTNNAKVSNATHTGDVTGATALTVDKTAITSKAAVTPVGADYILISDTSDSGNLKKSLISDLPGGGGGVASVTPGTNISVTGTSTNPIINSLSDRYKTTSSSSILIGNGSRTFTVNANLAYIPLQEVLIVYDASNHMHGTVTSYSGTTLVIDVKTHTGGGTFADWVINLDGVPVDAITGVGTANQITYFTSGQVIASLDTATYPSLTELSRVKNVGSQVVGTTDTNTLTNKRINARTGTVASSATPTINTDNVDYYSITALAVAITSFTTNLSGTPNIGQTLWISITDNGTARAITWGASFESSGNVTLPTTTVISTRLDVAFIWNEATSKWRCVGVA